MKILQKPIVVVPIILIVLGSLIYGIKKLDSANYHKHGDGSVHTNH